MDAIYYGDLNTNLATNGKETVQLSNFIKDNDAVRLKEELNTKPQSILHPRACPESGLLKGELKWKISLMIRQSFSTRQSGL